MKIAMLPSVAGGIGHIARTAALARMLRRLDPTVQIEYVLDTDRLRPFNIDATQRMGFRPRLLPSRSRDNRDAIVRACLGDVDVIVDDVARYLLPLRAAVPETAWISILMHPVGDELFMDWPFMLQMDALIWPYAPLVGLPPELSLVEDRVVRTGPFLETDDVVGKSAARAKLGLVGDAPVVVFAPRGFPFGRDYGERVLSGIHGAVSSLRREACPDLRLALFAVADRRDLNCIVDASGNLPDWVMVENVVSASDALLFNRAADILIAEGTSTMHEAAALRTPLVIVPGPFQEAELLGQRLGERGAAALIPHDRATAKNFMRAFEAILSSERERTTRTDLAYSLIAGGGGVRQAAELVLDVAERRKYSRQPRVQAAKASAGF